MPLKLIHRNEHKEMAVFVERLGKQIFHIYTHTHVHTHMKIANVDLFSGKWMESYIHTQIYTKTKNRQEEYFNDIPKSIFVYAYKPKYQRQSRSIFSKQKFYEYVVIMEKSLFLNMKW